MEKFAAFFDIDNTLTAPHIGIPDNVRNAINRARELGHQVFINTGSSLYHIPKDLLAGMTFDGIVCGLGGSGIYRGKTLRERVIDPSMVAEKTKYFAARKATVVLEGLTGIYAYGRQEGFNRAYPDITGDLTIEEASREIGVSKLSIMRPITEEEVEALKPLEVFIHAAYSETHFPDCNKAEAMLFLAEYAGFDRSHCIAFGDSFNDEDMLRAAGHSVVVANGREEMKRIAEYVCPSSALGGVADGLAHFIPEMAEFIISN